jgi:hypothetical protein
LPASVQSGCGVSVVVSEVPAAAVR